MLVLCPWYPFKLLAKPVLGFTESVLSLLNVLNLLIMLMIALQRVVFSNTISSKYANKAPPSLFSM